MIDISIIIVSWNAKELLDECLQSIYKNPFKCELETIIVDNASTDGAPYLVKEKYPQVKLICNSENLGFAKANNIGIEKSTGKYVCLINSDAVALDNCLELMCNYMNQNPKIGILGPKVLYGDGRLQLSCKEFPTFWKNICQILALEKFFPKSKLFGGEKMLYWSHDSIREVDYMGGCFLMVRKCAIDHVGLLDDTFFFYGEDKDWCKRFWKAGWKVVYFPEARAIHYSKGSYKDPVKLYIQMTNANIQYYSKHHGRLAKITFIWSDIIRQTIRILGYGVLYLIKPSVRDIASQKIQRSQACLRWIINTLVDL
jgi:GT2 family glycosyltransferase